MTWFRRLRQRYHEWIWPHEAVWTTRNLRTGNPPWLGYWTQEGRSWRSNEPKRLDGETP